MTKKTRTQSLTSDKIVERLAQADITSALRRYQEVLGGCQRFADFGRRGNQQGSKRVKPGELGPFSQPSVCQGLLT